MDIVPSPCIKICTYDPGAGLCLGCGRSLEEIAAWAQMSVGDRQRIMEALPQRLKAMSAPAS
jgi:predicted Fe-S protein YdhL (DUF1289 family)